MRELWEGLLGTTYRIRVWSTDGTSVSSEAREMDVTTVESGECFVHASVDYCFRETVVVYYLTVFFPLCVQQQCIVIIYSM